jgi:hypothetical protein
LVMVVAPMPPELMVAMVLGVGTLTGTPMPVPAVAVAPLGFAVERMHSDHGPLGDQANRARRCCLCARDGYSSR